jgi:hypothetical protein
VGKGFKYRCGNRDAKCSTSRDVAPVDREVWDAIAEVIRNPDVLDETAKRSNRNAKQVTVQAELREAERLSKDVSKSRHRLIDLFVAGRTSQADFDTREKPLAQEETRLKSEVECLTALVTSGVEESLRRAAAAKYCKLIVNGLDRLDEAQRQALLRRLNVKVTVTPTGSPLPATSRSLKLLDSTPQRL